MRTPEQQRAYYREWIKTHREEARVSRRKWRADNKEKVDRFRKEWALANPEKVKRKNIRWRISNRESIRTYNKNLHQQYKLQVIMAYGGHCNCCGENDMIFLTLEHEKHDGKSHRKVKGVFYLSLIRRGFPRDEGLSVLCMNCNWATRLGEVCPHKKKLLEIVPCT